MFAETLTYSDGSANHAYSVVTAGEYKRVRRVSESDLNTPELLTISHDVNPKTNVSRSLVKFDTQIVSAAGLVGNIRAHLVLEVPRSVAVAADVSKVTNQLSAFLATAGNVDKLLNLES